MKPTLCGYPVVVSPFLPIHPSDAEDGRRIVRHGLADVLHWLGEDLGPEPGVPTRIILSSDGAVGGLMFAVDQQTYDRIRDEWAA